MKLKLEKLLTAGFAAALGASFIAANPLEAKPPNNQTWEEEYLTTPELASWAKENPEPAAAMKQDWERLQAIKEKGSVDNFSDCELVGRVWNYSIKRCESIEETAARVEADMRPYRDHAQHDGCPPGTRQYQKTALFGLIKGKTLCLSDYEAESLRAQQLQNIQNNIRNSQPKFINCTSNIFGNYVSTSCY